jgi:hypothetical protein
MHVGASGVQLVSALPTGPAFFKNQTLSVSILLNVIAVVCITKACQYFWNLHSGGAFSVLFNQGTILV